MPVRPPLMAKTTIERRPKDLTADVPAEGVGSGIHVDGSDLGEEAFIGRW